MDTYCIHVYDVRRASNMYVMPFSRSRVLFETLLVPSAADEGVHKGNPRDDVVDDGGKHASSHVVSGHRNQMNCGFCHMTQQGVT